jgi:hypothetical protein
MPTRCSSVISWSRKMHLRASAKQRISRHNKPVGGAVLPYWVIHVEPLGRFWL